MQWKIDKGKKKPWITLQNDNANLPQKCVLFFWMCSSWTGGKITTEDGNDSLVDIVSHLLAVVRKILGCYIWKASHWKKNTIPHGIFLPLNSHCISFIRKKKYENGEMLLYICLKGGKIFKTCLVLSGEGCDGFIRSKRKALWAKNFDSYKGLYSWLTLKSLILVAVNFMYQLDLPWSAQVKHSSWVYLWGCFWLRLAFELVDSVKDTALPDVGDHCPIHWGPEQNEKPSKEELVAPSASPRFFNLFTAWAETYLLPLDWKLYHLFP